MPLHELATLNMGGDSLQVPYFDIAIYAGINLILLLQDSPPRVQDGRSGLP